MKTRRGNRYNPETAKMYTNFDEDIILLSTDFEDVHEYKDGEYTEKVIAYRLLFGTPNDFFKCKFADVFDLPDYGSAVDFKGLVACEVENNVYFKADSCFEIKHGGARKLAKA